MYNDDWVRSHGFLTIDASGLTVDQILQQKKLTKAISVSPRDTVDKAVTLMKKHDISQLLVVIGNKLVGKVTENHLMKGLFDKSIGPTNHIAAVLDPEVITVSPHESIERVAQLLNQNSFVVVMNISQRPLGVITRIDLIEYYI